MVLRSLTLKNYRTYKSQSFSFHKNFNLIVGNNAQGKTNLLESIYFLCNFRPFKQTKNEELIAFGEPSAGLKGEIISNSSLNEIHINLIKGKKNVRINGKIIYNLSKYFGRFNVVLYLPSDLKIIKGSPQVRRQYFDALISSLSNEHLKDLKDYYRVLTQRNSLLSRGSKISDQSIGVWDDRLSEIGSRLVKRRMKTFRVLKDELNKLYSSTSGINSQIDIQYKTSYMGSKDIQTGIKNRLEGNYRIDLMKGHTTVGPHRDVIEIEIDGRNSYKYASQGESKNLVLALKASEISLYNSFTGKNPILLLDDITSELDRKRKGFLFGLLLDYEGQIFVTTTGVDEIPYKGEKKVFSIEKGKPVTIS